MSTAEVTGQSYHVSGHLDEIKQKVPPNSVYQVILTTIVTLCITVTSGVCSKALSSSHPIFIEKNQDTSKLAYVSPLQKEAANRHRFVDRINKKYPSQNISYPAYGVAHIKMTRYINSKPIKINIVEIDRSANHLLSIKPQTAGVKLNSRAQIRTIAQKNNSIAAINAGYFKPQTWVPRGALVLKGEVLTGPIHNRVGIGDIEKKEQTSFLME